MGKALIIGGTGFIGMEMGEAFVTRGIETEIINRGDLPAPRWDPELSQALLGEIARRGVIFTPATELHSTLQRLLGHDPHRRPDVLEKTIRRKHNVYRSYRMERLRRSFFCDDRPGYGRRPQEGQRD